MSSFSFPPSSLYALFPSQNYEQFWNKICQPVFECLFRRSSKYQVGYAFLFLLLLLLLPLKIIIINDQCTYNIYILQVLWGTTPFDSQQPFSSLSQQQLTKVESLLKLKSARTPQQQQQQLSADKICSNLTGCKTSFPMEQINGRGKWFSVDEV
jgi:hypothetical protein